MTPPLTVAGALVLAFSLTTPSFGADFATVYRQAIEHDSTFAEARAKFEAAQEKIPQGRAGLLPSVALSANSTQNRQEIDNRRTGVTNNWNFNSNGYTLSLTQPLFRWQNWLGYDQSKLVVAQAEAALANARQDLILRTAQAYFDVLQAEENLKAAESFKSSVAGQLDIARKAFEIGTGIKTDVHDAETRFELASSQVIAAQTELEVRKRLLEFIVGPLSSSLNRKREGAILTPPQPADVGKWLAATEYGNLAIQQQRLAAEIASREVDRQRAAHFPTLDLVASTGRNSTVSGGAREITDADRIGLQLNIPIFQGGEVSSKTAEASANRRAALFALETARRSAIVSTQQAYLAVVNGLAQISTLQAALAAARKAVTSNKDAFDVGVRLNIDVLNSQSQAFNAYRELTKANVDTLIAQLKLKAAVGTLGEEDVLAINALLEKSGNQ